MLPTRWDLELDVLIAGFGYAGGVAAIEAHDLGLKTAIFEKMPIPGGISICSGGGVRGANDADSAFAYLEATCGGLTPDPVLRAMADGMVEVRDYMGALAEINGAPLVNVAYPGNYPFPGYRELSFTMFGGIPDFDQFRHYPHARGLRGGARHFKVIEDNVARRGVPVHFRSPVERLISTPEGRVGGAWVNQRGERRAVKARRGVILACGGFEADAELKRQFLSGHEMLSAAVAGNTGDGIRMAQAAGAPLWHMTNVHGTYGFRNADPDYPLGVRLHRLPDWNAALPLPAQADMAWIVVDRHARRYMNEYPPYMQDTGHRAMLHLDEPSTSYPRIPSFLIFDEVGRSLYPMAIPAFNDPQLSMEWSEDNLSEVELGILERADSIEELAMKLKLDAAALVSSVERWNQGVARGEDDDFGRPSATMRPVASPPYYGGAVWPIVSNTQGGPVHDERWRILDAFGEPIWGLYEAGELGGIWGHLYLAGGNLAECYIGAWNAARHAASEAPW